MSRPARRLARRIRPPAEQPALTLAQARVDSVQGDTLTLDLHGTLVAGVRRLASYPDAAAGDVCWALAFGLRGGAGDLVALCRQGRDRVSGRISATTDSNGDLTVTHNAGWVPQAVHVAEETPGGVSAWTNTRILSRTSTQFTARILGIDASVLANTSITGAWTVFR